MKKKYTQENKQPNLWVEEADGKIKFLYEYNYPFYIETELLLRVVQDYLKERLDG